MVVWEVSFPSTFQSAENMDHTTFPDLNMNWDKEDIKNEKKSKQKKLDIWDRELGECDSRNTIVWNP